MWNVPFILGCLTLLAAWLGPSLLSSGHTFSAHMTAHMGVVAVAAPLIAIGIAGTRWNPIPRAPAVFSPLLASLLELAVVWLWHTPVLHAAARQDNIALVAEQGSFLLAGLYLWISALARPSGVVALVLTAMHMTLLGALIALAPRPLYAVHEHNHGLDDQHIGGAIMILVGGISYLAGGLWLSVGLLRHFNVSRYARRA